MTTFATFRTPGNLYSGDLRVQLPELGEVLSLWMDPKLRTPERTAILTVAEIRRFTRREDGAAIDRELALAIAADRVAWRAYREARDAALTAATEGGTVYAQCPNCRSWEADLIPLALAVGLHVPFHPIANGAGALAVPALAADCRRTLTGAPPASRVTLALPHSPGRQRVEFASDPGARLPIWQARSERLFRDSPADTEDWELQSPGWHALLRLGALAASWPEPGVLDDVRRLARVSLASFLFVDNVYYLTHCVPSPADAPLLVGCQLCGTTFQPLAPPLLWPDV